MNTTFVGELTVENIKLATSAREWLASNINWIVGRLQLNKHPKLPNREPWHFEDVDTITETEIAVALCQYGSYDNGGDSNTLLTIPISLFTANDAQIKEFCDDAIEHERLQEGVRAAVKEQARIAADKAQLAKLQALYQS